MTILYSIIFKTILALFSATYFGEIYVTFSARCWVGFMIFEIITSSLGARPKISYVNTATCTIFPNDCMTPEVAMIPTSFCASFTVRARCCCTTTNICDIRLRATWWRCREFLQCNETKVCLNFKQSLQSMHVILETSLGYLTWVGRWSCTWINCCLLRVVRSTWYLPPGISSIIKLTIYQNFILHVSGNM